MANNREAGWNLTTISAGGGVATVIKPAQTVPSPGKHIVDGIVVSFSGTSGVVAVSLQDCAAAAVPSQASVPSNASVPSIPSIASVPSAPTVFQAYVQAPAGGEPVVIPLPRGIGMTSGGPVLCNCAAAASTTVTIALNVFGRTINQ